MDKRLDNYTAVEHAILMAMGWPPALVARIEAEAELSKTGLIQTAIAVGLIKPSDFYGRVSNVLAFNPQPGNANTLILSKVAGEAWTVLEQPIPLPLHRGGVALNAQAAPVSLLASLADGLGRSRSRVTLLTRQSLIEAITRSFGKTLVHRAVDDLKARRPELSAKTGLAAWQAMAGVVLAGLFLGAFAVAPREVLTVGSLLLSVLFFLAIGLRAAAATSLLFTPLLRNGVKPLAELDDSELPPYTIFVPLFREAAILPYLAKALAAIDYPPAKLDIKLVLESVDEETIAAAKTLNLPGNVDLIVVPDREPRTKPKALNYALQFATGGLAVIFDAEDRPEPDQLRKAAAAFHHGPPDLVCLQARLDYFNTTENWLSRQFTIEYASLFRGLLPFLSRLGLPMPLGGTSNHFRIDVLRKLGAWDPYNVTEDADLGMRLRRAGYRCATLDSTTYEEACCQAGPWIKQRTRWLKGWMQTFGVHTRSPARTLRETGALGFLTFIAYFAGIIVSALAHPIFYAVIAYDCATGSLLRSETFMDSVFLWVAAANFVGGYAANIALALLSLRGTGRRHLMAHAIFIPVYWLFVSAAAYRAVWQLIRNPFYWEKTNHGVSKRLDH